MSDGIGIAPSDLAACDGRAEGEKIQSAFVCSLTVLSVPCRLTSETKSRSMSHITVNVPFLRSSTSRLQLKTENNETEHKCLQVISGVAMCGR